MRARHRVALVAGIAALAAAVGACCFSAAPERQALPSIECWLIEDGDERGHCYDTWFKPLVLARHGDLYEAPAVDKGVRRPPLR